MGRLGINQTLPLAAPLQRIFRKWRSLTNATRSFGRDRDSLTVVAERVTVARDGPWDSELDCRHGVRFWSQRICFETLEFSFENEVHHETHRTMLDRHCGDARDSRRRAGSVGENLSAGVSSDVPSGVSPSLALADGGLPADDCRHNPKPTISRRNCQPATTRVSAYGRLVVTKVRRLNQLRGGPARRHIPDSAQVRRRSLDGCRVRAQRPTPAVRPVQVPDAA